VFLVPFKIVRVPLEETDGRELRRPLSLPAAVCRAVSDSGGMRSSSDKGNMVSAGIVLELITRPYGPTPEGG